MTVVDTGRTKGPEQADPQARVTIADIAGEAGVSVATVSKVLNGHAHVAEATRGKVEALLESHNYLRRRSRPTRTVGLIDLVINELDSPWSVEVVRGVEETTAQHDSGLVVTAVHGRSADTLRWLNNLAKRGSDGVILAVTALAPGQRRTVQELGVPLVVVDPVGNPDASIPSVGATNWHGGLAATQHLLGLGHRRIGIITGPDDVLSARARLDGYRAALESAGLGVDPALEARGDFHHETGFTGARELLALPDRPTAIFASSDLQALGAYDAVRRAGLQVGRDVSIVGFDDLPAASWASPPLTTVRQPLSDMAAMAARIVLQGVEAVLPGGMRRMELATELVERESTAPPR
ncbi:LacI family DNA-binding transcriptional regulator [Streptomyces sp. V4-01]|uniref:LacI family DNA-binding transcriptional regulator n=1 Tax=Actinacidiphila polyblastidii TaxID=3110430 RepID=A0ABU7PC11_9ACTN|nr:LacI family DNA-binding transcriptional regulator [Streptomyces sp. V4-01]